MSAKELSEALQNALKDILSEQKIDADNIDGLDEAVETAIGEYLLQNPLTSDDIRDFDNAVATLVSSEDHSHEASDISGLDDSIQEAVTEATEDTLESQDFKAKLRDLLHELLPPILLHLLKEGGPGKP